MFYKLYTSSLHYGPFIPEVQISEVIHCKCLGFSLGFLQYIRFYRGCTTFVRVLQTNAWRKTLVRVFLGFYRALYLVHGHIFRWRHGIAGKESDVTREIEMTSTQKSVYFSFDLQQITE